MSSLKKTIINIGLSFIIAFSGFFFYKSTTSNVVPNEVRPLKDKALDVNIINSSIANLALSNNLNEASIKKEIPTSIDKLYKTKTSIEKIEVPSKSAMTKTDFLNGLNSNILFYKQLLGILNNPKGKDINESLKNLNKFYNDSCILYSKCSILDVKFSKTNPNFYSNIEGYIYSKSTVHQDDSITELQNKTFMVSFENIVEKFSNLNKDYLLSVKKCREKKASYDELLNSLEKNTIELKDLSLELYSLSIPNDAKDCYESFLTSINCYKDFNQELIFSVKSEIESLKKSSSNLDNFYSSTKQSKSTFDNSFIEFEEIFKKYKDNFN